MPKKFEDWIEVKARLHNTDHKAPFVNEGDIWWFSVGENVGSEINGKSNIFTQPRIIYKKLAHGFYLVIPTTSQQRTGSWYIPFDIKERRCPPVYTKFVRLIIVEFGRRWAA